MTQAGLNVADGVFPDGSTQWRIDTERSTWVLPDWSIVDSPGYLYTRWGTGGRPEMELTPSVRTGARTTDRRTYASGSGISVRVWRTWNEYNDLTELLDADSGLPVVRLAENLPGSISLAVDADWEHPSRNPLSASYTGWRKLVGSIGTDADGPIRTGAYLTVHVLNSSSKWAPVAEGWISTITPEDARVRIECADGLSVLSRQGATLRRNYYRARVLASGDVSYNDGLVADISAMPSGSIVDTRSFQWLVIKRWPGSSRISGGSSEKGFVALSTDNPSGVFPYVILSFVSPVTCRLEHVTTHVANQELLSSALCFMEAKVDGRGSWTSSTYSLGAFSTAEPEFTWAHGPEVQAGQRLTLTWYARSDASPSQTMHLHMWFGDNDGAEIQCDCTVKGDSTFQVRGMVPDWAIYAYEYRPCTGTVSGTSVTDVVIDGVQDQTDDSLVDPPGDRFEFAYYSAEATRDEIMPDLIMSHNALPFMSGSTDAVLGVYRIGGGFMSQYLQKIADVMGDDGQRRTVTARGCAVMAIASGVRHERTDEPTLTVCRNASASGVPSGAVEFVSFSPRMTLKGRPSLAVLRGSWAGDEAVPMVVAVEAEGSSDARGLVIEEVVTDSDASDVPSAMRAAWASLDSESLDAWEGTLVVPGFLPGLIERTGAHAGAGAVIAIYDERYGLSGYKVLVKEVRADYGKRTTELTVTSHSPAYASTVPDTAAAVQTAGDIGTGAGLLYEMQYVRVVSSTAVTGTLPPKMEVSTSAGTAWWECEDVTAVRTPTRIIFTGRVAGERGASTDREPSPYAVAQVRLNEGTAIDIDPYRRPDLYTGQTLIVQVDCPRS